MSRSRINSNDFSSGVLSPQMMGRVDTDTYNSGLKEGNNIVIGTTGGISRRAGSAFITDYGIIDYMRIFPFTFNVDQKYVIIFRLNEPDPIGSPDVFEVLIDIYRDDVIVVDGIVTPYTTEKEMKELDFAQSADIMVFTQGDNQPYYLRRLGSDTSWDFVPVPIVNAPCRGMVCVSDTNPSVTETPTCSDGSTASCTTGECADGGTPTCNVDFTLTTLQEWSDDNGWPQYTTFHQGRLWFAGSKTRPQSVWASVTQDFFNFDLGSFNANDSIQETLDTDFINPITAIYSARKLQLFTTGDEFVNNATSPTPSTSSWSRQSTYGSRPNISPVTIDGSTLFVDGTGRTVRKYTYSDEDGGYKAPSISANSEHLIKTPTRMGVLRGADAQPANFIYVVNVDGTVAVLNISKAHNLMAWVEWTTQGAYKDIMTLDDDVYMLVERRAYDADADDIRLHWILERVEEKMHVDCGQFRTAINETTNVSYRADNDNFFGVYFDATGDAGYIVIVSEGVEIYRADYLKPDPKRTYIGASDLHYATGGTFSYNEAIRELYFDKGQGFTWFMFGLEILRVIDYSVNYIDGMTHLIGREVVSNLDGNIQEPQYPKKGDTVEVLDKVYPDGIDWRLDADNSYKETSVDGVIREILVTYDEVVYTNPVLTQYGYLISGNEGEVDSEYIEKGTVVDSDINLYDIETFTADGDFEVVPFETSVELCIVAGGAGGGFKPVDAQQFGGLAGQGFSGTIEVSPEETISVVIGIGSDGNNGNGVGDGTASSFGAYVSVAGAIGADITTDTDNQGYDRGVGESHPSPCGGSHSDGINDGSAYGGQASILGDGGRGQKDGTGGAGGYGAGGGGSNDANGIGTTYDGGKGGDGLAKIKHSVNNVTVFTAEVRKVSLVASSTVDGVAIYPNQTFTTGQVGLFYPVVAETMPLSVSNGAGTLVNEPKRIVAITSRYFRTQGVYVNGVSIPERRLGEENLDEAPLLLTGIDKTRHLGYNRTTSVTITQNDPMPFTLLGLDIELNF